MIVVDTTVWVDFLNGRDTRQVGRLVDLIETDAGVALTDLVLAEVLQGIRDESQVQLVDDRLGAFDVLRLDGLDDFRRAAALYRQARRRGLTIRRTADCLIASVCVREQLPLLHNDADFERLASCTPLMIDRW
ncbi:MAG: PIN domain nuclease [Ilumatobacteraceae bacterium]